MGTINLYLTFDGNCEEAFNFYKLVFGGEFEQISRFGDMPPNPEYPVKERDKNKIMHVSLAIGKESVLMGCDKASGFGDALNKGNNFAISVSQDSPKEADKIFEELSEGGEVRMPMGKMFWGAYFGMFIDKFGLSWMVSAPLAKDEN
ncbi:MAG: VOC family protein [Gillisia sp.]